MDEHCRITVVSGRREMDLAVPAEAPITTYIGSVARMCGAGGNDMMPAAWSLGTVTEAPFPPERSLTELGIVDGQILYLRDMAADEYAEPVVRDVGERVAEVVGGVLNRTWDARARTVAVLALGLGWLASVLFVLALRHQASAGALTGVAVTAGLVLPAVAWIAAERRWPMRWHMVEGLGLTAVPFLTFAGFMLATAHRQGVQSVAGRTGLTAAGVTVAGIAACVLAGALLAYIATPGVTTSAVLFGAAIAGTLAGVLAAVRADRVESASVVAVVSFGLLTAAPMTVSQIVPFAYRRSRVRFGGEHDEGDDAVESAVREGIALLVAWGGFLSAVLAVTLVVMASSHSPYAVATAGCLGLALLLRCGAARLASEVLPAGLAGVIGLFTLLMVQPGHLGWPGWTAPFTAGLINSTLVIYGLRLVFRPGLPSTVRPRWLTSFSSVLGGISVPLAIATSGALSRLVELGHHL